MENDKMLDILSKLCIWIENGSLDIAKSLIRLEIENLKGITEKNCHNTIYNYHDWYCKDCRNLNCNYNKNNF